MQVPKLKCAYAAHLLDFFFPQRIINIAGHIDFAKLWKLFS